MSKTAVDDKVGDEVVAINWIDPVVFGQALAGALSQKCVIGPLSETLSNESAALLGFRQSFREGC